jgi:hypothetical protein
MGSFLLFKKINKNRRLFFSIGIFLIFLFFLIQINHNPFKKNITFQFKKEKIIFFIDFFEILRNRIKKDNFNLLSTLIFFLSILHIFFCNQIIKFKKKLKKKSFLKKNNILFICLNILGKIEIAFLFWAIPLTIIMLFYYNLNSILNFYSKMQYSEAIFIFVIILLVSTKPIFFLSEKVVGFIARIGRNSVISWWFSILTITPILGSIITEPAAVTIASNILKNKFFIFNPSSKLKYITFALLLSNISFGGSITHFAAPPILIISKKWNWNLKYVFFNFGWKAILSIFLSNIFYLFIFYKDFISLSHNKKVIVKKKISRKEKIIISQKNKIPIYVYILNSIFLILLISCSHSILLLTIIFLIFIGFHKITKTFQKKLNFRESILLFCFFIGLNIHGPFQKWWIEVFLISLNKMSLFIGSILLTAFNDNAAITFLASMVSEISNSSKLQKAVVGGALAGGGLTIIANAPNPIAQSILKKFFYRCYISMIYLFISSLIPTLFFSLCFICL